LADKVSRLPNLNFGYYFNQPASTRPLVQQPLTFFVEDNTDKKAPVDEMWEICNSYMESRPGKRKLVSLNEANEVARRLAETDNKVPTTYHGRAYWKRLRQSGNGEEEKEEKDEVATWYWESRIES
jgi:hypothetical protein